MQILLPRMTSFLAWRTFLISVGIVLLAMSDGAAVPAADLPATGAVVAELRAFDEAMQRFMAERGIRASSLAVMKDGKLLLSRGYGHADATGKRPLPPDAPFRIASISKPITAAAARKLIGEGKLSLDTQVFPLLDLKPPPGQQPDPRLNDITVRHLLAHQGGWDRMEAFDPMFRPLKIAEAFGKPGPATSADIVRYMVGQPLQFPPGSRSCYSNFGYCVLGRVIEKATGQSYVDYVQEAILKPLDLRSIELGRSLPADRNPREPFYSDPHKGRNVLRPKSKQPVPEPDGTFYLEAMDAHGGLIASSPDLVKFLQAYWISGEPRQPGQRASFNFFGSLPGTFTMVLQRKDGLNIAALFNQRTDPSGRDYAAIKEYLNEAADRTWEKENGPGRQ